MGSRVHLDAVEYRRIVCLYQELNPGLSSRSPSIYRLCYPMLKNFVNVRTHHHFIEKLMLNFSYLSFLFFTNISDHRTDRIPVILSGRTAHSCIYVT
jgi:hypothetical protein